MKKRYVSLLCAVTLAMTMLLEGCGSKETQPTAEQVSTEQIEESNATETQEVVETEQEATNGQTPLDWAREQGLEPLTTFIYNESGKNTILTPGQEYKVQENDRMVFYTEPPVDRTKWETTTQGMLEPGEGVAGCTEYNIIMGDWEKGTVSLSAEKGGEIVYSSSFILIGEKVDVKSTLAKIDTSSDLPAEEWFASMLGVVEYPFIAIINEETNEKKVLENGEKYQVEASEIRNNEVFIWVYNPNGCYDRGVDPSEKVSFRMIDISYEKYAIAEKFLEEDLEVKFIRATPTGDVELTCTLTK